MDEILGWLIAAAVIAAVVFFVFVYIVLPVAAVVLSASFCFGAFIAIKNYSSAFKEIVIDGNKE